MKLRENLKNEQRNEDTMKKNDRLTYSRMGLSDLYISNIGLGGQSISGRFCNNQDELSMKTMFKAVDEGINWFHTAPSYGTGYGEIMVGRALKEIPASERPYVFTTVTWVFDREDEGNDKAVRVKSLMPASMRKQLEGSLRRLGVDCIDLLQFHWPDRNTPIEESWSVMADFVKEGKVRTIGLSNHPLNLIKRCEAIAHVDCLQQPLSLVDRSMNGPYYDNGCDSGGLEVLEWAKANQSSIISFAPLQHGILGGKCNKDSVKKFRQAGDPLRPYLYWFQEPEYSRILNMVDMLRPVAQRHNVSVASVAIAWCLAWKGITGAICGACRPDQLDAFIDAAGLNMTEQDWAEIAAAIESSGACKGTCGDGPAFPIRS